MIKIKIKKKLTNEALIKFSAPVQKKITTFVKKAMRDGVQARRVFEVPLRDVIYDKKTILTGLPFLYYLNLNNTSLGNETAQQILNKTFKIPVRVETDVGEGKLGGYGVGIKDNISRMVIKIFASNANIDTVDNIIRHEMQHMTQHLNDMCISYSKLLKEVGDPQKVPVIPMQTDITKFGLGQQKTGIKTRGVSREAEYEPYISDIVNSFYNKLKTLHKKALKKDLQTLGAHATAVKYTNLLLSNWRFQDSYEGLNKILTVLLDTRPKETPKDMLKSLEAMLQQA